MPNTTASARTSMPMSFAPIAQVPRELRGLEVRTRQPLSALVGPVRQAIADVTKDVMIRRVVTLSDQVDRSLAAENLMMPAVELLWSRRAAARIHRALRSAGVLGRSTDRRDWDSHGARRDPGGNHPAGAERYRFRDSDRHGARHRARTGVDAPVVGLPVRADADRPFHDRARDCGTRGSRSAGRLLPVTTRGWASIPTWRYGANGE